MITLVIIALSLSGFKPRLCTIRVYRRVLVKGLSPHDSASNAIGSSIELPYSIKASVYILQIK